ncbi:MAG: hypothetical protein FJ276_13895 [Planctomycetes bacterium]|nr:hypothetical protein [Planctomycetota bacterium]
MSIAPDSHQNSPPIPHREGGTRSGIDWVALVGFLFSWTFAIGSYVFFVLLLGLIGGMFGGVIDVALSLLNLPWRGHGMQCGWTLGAVVAAIGLPLGWVRPNERRFSFPRPVKLRQSLAERVADRRRKRAESGKRASDREDSCDLGSAVKGAGLCGLIGTVLGFVLGMFLMMCWFSLAMSPFAPGGWFDALEFLSEPSRGGGGGTSVSSSHPMAISLVLVPPLVLGAAGFVGGGIYGLVSYVQCLKTISREERERHRRRKRQDLRNKTWPWYALVIGIVVTMAVRRPSRCRNVRRARARRAG